VDSAHSHRRPRKIRRTGRHTQPSQVEKVAEVATKAAPAVAIAGVLVATAPQASAAVSQSAATSTVAEQVHTVRTEALVQHSQPATRTYTVRPGDTLSLIAQRFYGNPADWAWLYHVNSSVVHNPDSIYAGQVLKVPAGPPAHAHADAAAMSYTPKHAKKLATRSTSSTATLTSSATALSGKLGCSGLEALWEAAGGSHAEAFTAAEIAMAESGGNEFALSPTNDYGYWQINGSHGPAMATFNPMGNAKAAIAISDDGHDWGAWTTYTSGAYSGRC
jgi:LysM repeat protein